MTLRVPSNPRIPVLCKMEPAASSECGTVRGFFTGDFLTYFISYLGNILISSPIQDAGSDRQGLDG